MRPSNYGDSDDKRIKFLSPGGKGGTAPQPQQSAPAHYSSHAEPLRSQLGGDQQKRGQFARTGPIRIQGDLVSLAQEDDRDALQAIFGQFIPPDETIVWAGYLGKFGWLFGRRSFACMTDKRVGDISIGAFGEIVYQDALLEYFNSTVVYQPSRLGLYVLCGFAVVMYAALVLQFIAAMPDPGMATYLVLLVLSALIVPLVFEFLVRLYYSVMKCGIVLWIKDGVSIYMFTDRKLLTKANALLRLLRTQRDERVAAVGHI